MGHAASSVSAVEGDPRVRALGATAGIPSPKRPARTPAATVLDSPIADVLPPPSDRPVCMLSADDTLGDALRALRRHNISAIPLRDDAGWVLLDVTDIMALVVEAYEGGAGEDARRFAQLLEETILATPCRDVANFSKRNPVHTVSSSATVRSVLSIINTAPAHRVLVVDDQGNLIHLATQTDLLQLLGPLVFPPTDQATLVDRDLYGSGDADTGRLKSCPRTMHVMAAFTQCVRMGVRRMAVPGDATVQLATFGAWDVTCLLDGVDFTVGQVAKKAATATLETRVRDVVDQLATRVREVYLVDDVGAPVHVLTQSDCVRYVVQALEGSVPPDQFAL